MSFDVTTLALAKSYADQHGGGGGGASTAGDFIIKMTVEGHDEGYYTVTSCDTTIEQIDAAVAAEKRVVLIAPDTTSGMFWELPIVQASHGATYIFIAFTYSGYIMATVYKSGENEIWEYMNGGISAESVSYYNSEQQDVESVMAALNKLFTKSHTHANKDALDKLSDSNGKLQYNGEPIGGENTIYIPATLNTSSDPLTIETSATFEQIEAAYNLGREQILKLVAENFIYMLPLVFASPGGVYYFETINRSQGFFAAVTPTNEWGLEFYNFTPTPKEEIVNDVLAALPTWTGGNY